jgi:hypothetical protein
MVGRGHINQFVQLVELVLRVRLAPAVTVVRVVLRRVDIGVRLDRAVENQLIKAFLVGPRRTVETFDRAA